MRRIVIGLLLLLWMSRAAAQENTHSPDEIALERIAEAERTGATSRFISSI
jgi:hypothetical protein